MPLSASSPAYLHLLQNLALISLSLFFTPLCTFIAICSRIASPFTAAAKFIQNNRKRCGYMKSAARSRVILVTGVGMSKGLSIARAFYREGHYVIGADFEPFGVPVCGRFSVALKRFYKLPKPAPSLEGSKAYIEGLLKIVKDERVDLWVSCSGVASAIDDASAAEVIEKQSSCKTVQFGAEITKILDEKHSFIEQALHFGLHVPETYLINSVDEALAQLYPDKTPRKGHFIMKSVGLDDKIRADMTLLPRSSPEETRSHLKRLNPSASRRFVLQEFVNGSEYCTHSVIVRGQVVAFTACPSMELLMHYKALPPKSALSRAMQEFTETYAKKLGDVTGHFSIDFMLDEHSSESKLMDKLYPIECNPRAHTAVVLFEEESKCMVDAYISILKEGKMCTSELQAVVTPSITTGFYWIGHDIVTCVLMPLLSVLALKEDFSYLAGKWKIFVERVAYCKDGTYQMWDPLPFWWLYCIYWPGMFISATVGKSWWSRCNVSTTKMFRC